jgi:acyl carrier protein
MDQQLRDRLKSVLVNGLNFPLEPSDIDEETSLLGHGLGLDSVDVVSLMTKVENEFDIFFDAEELAEVTQSFGVLAAAIEAKLGLNGTRKGV